MSYLLADFLYLLAFLLLRLVSGVADGNQYSRFLVVTKAKELLAFLSIEVADPAGSETLLSSCQTQMLNSDGYVYITMMFAVRAYPLLVVQDAADNGSTPATSPC